jgi:hypothetical protein
MSRIGYRDPRYYRVQHPRLEPDSSNACTQAANEQSPPLDSSKAPQPPSEHGVMLLAAFREIFEARKVSQISTIAAVKALIERKGEPWAALWERDIAIGNVRAAGAQLARLLKPFGIAAHTIREPDGSTPKGYKLQHFEAAFSRYLPPKPHLDATTPLAHE